MLGLPWVLRGHSQTGAWRTTLQSAVGAQAPGQGLWQLPARHASHAAQSSSAVHSARTHALHGLPRAPLSHSHVAVWPRATQCASAPQRTRGHTFTQDPPSQLSSSGQSLLLWHCTVKRKTRISYYVWKRSCEILRIFKTKIICVPE